MAPVATSPASQLALAVQVQRLATGRAPMASSAGLGVVGLRRRRGDVALAYVAWARDIAKGLRGVNPWLEGKFDEAAELAERSIQPYW